MLDGFEHAAGAHCGSTSLTDVATYRRWGLSEPMCFGIGAGLGFSFIESEDGPTKQFVGRTPWLETAFHEHLGVTVEQGSEQTFEAAWDDVTAHLDAGRPVLLFVDIFYLPYYDSDVHFSPHVVLAVGYDEESVTLADSEHDDLQRLSLSNLRTAMGSEHGFFGELTNDWLVAMDDPTRSVADAARDGLRTTAEAMLEPESTTWAGDATNGLDGLRAFAHSLPDWPDLPDAEWCTRFAYQNVEKRGTGGSAFRGLFAPFVAEIEPELEAVDDAVVTEARGIDDDWGTVAQHLKQAGLADEPDESQRAYDAASEALLSVGDREEQLYERLLDRL
ncbi:BtrH N-terminal domain-containing protein [Haloarchaeobius sp. FL176]|uniref:BtrH N-terminal domain-containing protein n=1 Tax=Haloarchaeobius sp. FL176 TaxID=2967129 RepID=UPI00214835FA|nr:BtrH N-terminal domain-containing protein [Haloarchaeobius sp. FL176]